MVDAQNPELAALSGQLASTDQRLMQPDPEPFPREAIPAVKEQLQLLSQAPTVAEIKRCLFRIKELGSTVKGYPVEMVLKPILEAQQLLVRGSDPSEIVRILRGVPIPAIQEKCMVWLQDAWLQVDTISRPNATTRQLFDAIDRLMTLGYTELQIMKVGAPAEIAETKELEVVRESIREVGVLMRQYDELVPDGKIKFAQSYKQKLDRLIANVTYADNIDLKIYYEAVQKIQPVVSQLPDYQIPEQFRQRFIAYAAHREQAKTV